MHTTREEDARKLSLCKEMTIVYNMESKLDKEAWLKGGKINGLYNLVGLGELGPLGVRGCELER